VLTSPLLLSLSPLIILYLFLIFTCESPVKSGLSSCDLASSGPVPVGRGVTIPRSKGFRLRWLHEKRGNRNLEIGIANALSSLEEPVELSITL
jgi:hypothetical protein